MIPYGHYPTKMQTFSYFVIKSLIQYHYIISRINGYANCVLIGTIYQLFFVVAKQTYEQTQPPLHISGKLVEHRSLLNKRLQFVARLLQSTTLKPVQNFQKNIHLTLLRLGVLLKRLSCAP